MSHADLKQEVDPESSVEVIDLTSDDEDTTFVVIQNCPTLNASERPSSETHDALTSEISDLGECKVADGIADSPQHPNTSSSHHEECAFEADQHSTKDDASENLKNIHLKICQNQSHVCSECDKAFTRPHHLIRHMAKHSGRKFECKICKMAYSQRVTLEAHIRAHHESYSVVGQGAHLRSRLEVQAPSVTSPEHARGKLTYIVYM